MLGSRTRQVNTYGRRGHRIVDLGRRRDETSFDNDSPKRSLIQSNFTENSEDSDFESIRPAAPKVKRQRNHTNRIISPESTPEVVKSKPVTKPLRRSPKMAKAGRIDVQMPDRHPLGAIRPNTPKIAASTPVTRKKSKPLAPRITSLKPSSSNVALDIVVLDAQGRRVSEERRVSRSNVQVNPLIGASTLQKRKVAGRHSENDDSYRTANVLVTQPKITAHSESDDDYSTPQRKFPKKGRRTRQVIVSDDDLNMPVVKPHLTALPQPSPKNSGDLDDHRILSTTTFAPQNTVNKPSAVLATPRLSRQQPSYPTTSALLSPELSRNSWRPRQLTPLKGRSAAAFPVPPSPASPSMTTDFDDLTFDFSNLGISPSIVDLGVHGTAPAYLAPLLSECEQTTLHEFSAFIDMFPFDPLVRAAGDEPTNFQKIGEASYSEVFGIGNVVLKVIPLQDEENFCTNTWASTNNLDSPFTSRADDVLREMVVTRAMGETCDGFVQMLRSYIVRGKYPSLLLDLWDEFNERKGSESIRPGKSCDGDIRYPDHAHVYVDSFTVSQVYAIIVLPNGGPDLETYVFNSPTKLGWRQACSIFWQITRTLVRGW